MADAGVPERVEFGSGVASGLLILLATGRSGRDTDEGDSGKMGQGLRHRLKIGLQLSGITREEPKKTASKGKTSGTPGNDFMRTNLATVLDPNRRSNDAGEFDGALRRRIVGQEQALEKVVVYENC